MVNTAINQNKTDRIKNLYQQLNYFNGKNAETLSISEKLQLMTLYRSSQNIKGFPPLPKELQKLILETIRTQKTGSSNDIRMAAAAYDQQVRSAEVQAQIFASAFQRDPYLMYNRFNTTLQAIESGHLGWSTKVSLPNGQEVTFTDFLGYEAKKLEQEQTQLQHKIEFYDKKNRQALFTLSNMTLEERAKMLEEIKKIDPDIASTLVADLADENLMREIRNNPPKLMTSNELTNHAKEGRELKIASEGIVKRAQNHQQITQSTIKHAKDITPQAREKLNNAYKYTVEVEKNANAYFNRRNRSDNKETENTTPKPNNPEIKENNKPKETEVPTEAPKGGKEAKSSLLQTIKNAQINEAQNLEPVEKKDMTKTSLANNAQIHQPNTLIDSSYNDR